MRQAPPEYIIDQPRLLGEEVPSACALMRCEVCARHLRLKIATDWCDDAFAISEHYESLHSLKQIIAWCRTLATGADHAVKEEGFVDARTFSLESHIIDWNQPDTAEQYVWFYPMTENRLCLGMQVGPSIPALRNCLTWAQAHLDVVDAEARTTIAEGISTCLALLDQAERRVAAADFLIKAAIPADIIALVPGRVAREHVLLPISMRCASYWPGSEDTVRVVFADHPSWQLKEKLQFTMPRRLCHQTGQCLRPQVIPMLARRAAILAAIDHYYGPSEKVAAMPISATEG